MTDRPNDRPSDRPTDRVTDDETSDEARLIGRVARRDASRRAMASSSRRIDDHGALTAMVDSRVCVITNDGRHIVGVLRGYDQVTNVILEDCHERVYSSERAVERAPLGLYVIRGDNVCV